MGGGARETQLITNPAMPKKMPRREEREESKCEFSLSKENKNIIAISMTILLSIIYRVIGGRTREIEGEDDHYNGGWILMAA